MLLTTACEKNYKALQQLDLLLSWQFTFRETGKYFPLLFDDMMSKISSISQDHLKCHSLTWNHEPKRSLFNITKI